MAIKDFSDSLYFIDGVDGEYVEAAIITRTSSKELGHIRLFLYLKGSFNGERMTLKLTDSLTSPTVTYTSDEVLLSQTGASSEWLGWVRFDFDKEWMIDTESYHLMFKVDNYTESASKYVGVCIDYPQFEGAGTGNLMDRGAKFQLFDFE